MVGGKQRVQRARELQSSVPASDPRERKRSSNTVGRLWQCPRGLKLSRARVRFAPVSWRVAKSPRGPSESQAGCCCYYCPCLSSISFCQIRAGMNGNIAFYIDLTTRFVSFPVRELHRRQPLSLFWFNPWWLRARRHRGWARLWHKAGKREHQRHTETPSVENAVKRRRGVWSVTRPIETVPMKRRATATAVKNYEVQAFQLPPVAGFEQRLPKLWRSNLHCTVARAPIFPLTLYSIPGTIYY